VAGADRGDSTLGASGLIVFGNRARRSFHRVVGLTQGEACAADSNWGQALSFGCLGAIVLVMALIYYFGQTQANFRGVSRCGVALFLGCCHFGGGMVSSRHKLQRALWGSRELGCATGVELVLLSSLFGCAFMRRPQR